MALKEDDVLFEEEEPVETEKPDENQDGRNNTERIVQYNSQNRLNSSQNIRYNASNRKMSYTRPPKTTPSYASMAGDGRKFGSQDMHAKRLSAAKRNTSTSSFAYVSTPFHGSTLSAFDRPNDFASQFSLKSITESVADVAYCCFCCKTKPRKEKNKFFDVSLLADPIYLIILLSSSTNAISYTNFIILLPSHADNIGLDKARGAYLLSTVSALDLVGRIGGSALSDLNLMPKKFYFVGGLFFSGITLATVPFLHSYLAISICCALFGLAAGINCGVTTLVMAEILGVDRLMSTYGISLFVNGCLQLVGPPICGLWFEIDKNYTHIFVTFGIIFIAGASLWLLMPIIERIQKKKIDNALRGEKV